MFEDEWTYPMQLDWIVQYWNTKKEQEMSRYGYYDYNTRSGDVAKAALEALEQGVTLDKLLEKNATVRNWWGQHIKERLAEQVRVEKERERRQKAAEKKALEDAKRAEVAAKLTPEELAVFGLTAAGKQKRK
jgi:hypothetical protein